MDAFDADVLIYAAAAGHVVGSTVTAHLDGLAESAVQPAAVGSVLLVPELLSKPIRQGETDEVASLVGILARVALLPTEPATADLAAALGAAHGLRAVDSVHLATAVLAGADRFVTNNRRDFASTITEIDVVYPEDLTVDRCEEWPKFHW